MSFRETQLPNKITVLVLAILLLSGVYLRFFNLGKPSFWVDELNHVYAGIDISEGKEPAFPSGVSNDRALLYSRLVGMSFSVFGANEFSARFGSAVFGVLSILLIYIVGRGLFNSNVGLIAAFFLTFAHPAIGWSRTSRMYTLFQFLFLLAVFLFYKGFEARANSKEIGGVKEGFLQRLDMYFRSQGIRWPFLLASGVVFLISIKVHLLTGLFAATVLAYCAVVFLGESFNQGIVKSVTSKYFAGIAIISLGILIGIVAFDLLTFVQYALDFHPEWARYGRAEDSHYFYWLLTASDQFPLAALFLFGAIQAFVRLNKTAVFCLLGFVIPLFFHSFVFSYKVSNYIFNTYPFFVLIIAFGVHNLYQTEVEGLSSRLSKTGWGGRITPRFLRLAMIVVFVCWIPMTIWFRVAVNIPKNYLAGSNGAITHYDWKGATNMVAQNELQDDVIISTLPLTVLYYLGGVDFNLNLAHLDESLKWTTPSTNGRHHEFYTNIPSIESVDDLKRIMGEHKRGWLIADIYRLNREQYVPHELAQFIQTHLNKSWSDEKETMAVYSWSV
jgi:4-amino-4-deoxy-L-arabinose transferase-like glycosyltransferase